MEGLKQGDIWWANLPLPIGSGPGYRRPIIVVQGDALNQSRIATFVCVPLTSNLRMAGGIGNVLLSAEATGLPEDSVANISQITSADQRLLDDRVGKLGKRDLQRVLAGIDIVLGR